MGFSKAQVALMRANLMHEMRGWVDERGRPHVYVPGEAEVLAALEKRAERNRVKSSTFESLGLTEQAKTIASMLCSPICLIGDVLASEQTVEFSFSLGFGKHIYTYAVKRQVWEAAKIANERWRYSWWNNIQGRKWIYDAWVYEWARD